MATTRKLLRQLTYPNDDIIVIKSKDYKEQEMTIFEKICLKISLWIVDKKLRSLKITNGKKGFSRKQFNAVKHRLQTQQILKEPNPNFEIAINYGKSYIWRIRNFIVNWAVKYMVNIITRFASKHVMSDTMEKMYIISRTIAETEKSDEYEYH